MNEFYLQLAEKVEYICWFSPTVSNILLQKTVPLKLSWRQLGLSRAKLVMTSRR